MTSFHQLALLAARRRAINGFDGAQHGGCWNDADEYADMIAEIERRMQDNAIQFRPWIPGQPAEPED